MSSSCISKRKGFSEIPKVKIGKEHDRLLADVKLGPLMQIYLFAPVDAGLGQATKLRYTTRARVETSRAREWEGQRSLP